MAAVRLQSVRKCFGSTVVVDDVSLQIEDAKDDVRLACHQRVRVGNRVARGERPSSAFGGTHDGHACPVYLIRADERAEVRIEHRQRAPAVLEDRRLLVSDVQGEIERFVRAGGHAAGPSRDHGVEGCPVERGPGQDLDTAAFGQAGRILGVHADLRIRG